MQASAYLMTGSGLVALALTLALTGCEYLGNPPGESLTESNEWSNASLRLESRARTLPMRRSNELLESVEGGQADHFDSEARPGSMVSLVTVNAHWSAPPGPGKTQLTTLFRFHDGGELERDWVADRARDIWYAGFALPARPTSALTFISPR